MAKFTGVQWAPKQFQYVFREGVSHVVEGDSKAYAVSRSVHYGIGLVFEGIRFYCAHTVNGLEIRFLNLEQNLSRFLRGLRYSISNADHSLLPSEDEMRTLFLDGFFRRPELRAFLEQMANTKAQGYFRPFTLDEAQSIGVTFPEEPAIRAAICSYESYLGEPFSGVVVPNLVRAVTGNGTGHLKLGSNYLISVKAIQRAKEIDPTAGAALFLDDRPDQNVLDRKLTEWDSSCCLVALRDGRLIRIPDGPLILPSVTIRGVTALAEARGIMVEERPITYGELVEWEKTNQLVCVCSIGTAGVLNRCQRLTLVDAQSNVIAVHQANQSHELYAELAAIRSDYWRMYLGEVDLPEGVTLERHDLSS